MKKLTLVFALIVTLGLGAYVLLKNVMHKVIADAIVSKSLPSYLPEQVKYKVNKIKDPVNEGANTIIKTIHKSNVTLDQLLKAIDDVTEDQAYAMLDTLNQTTIKNEDQVFDIAKHNFPVDFDIELFRKPYKDKVNVNFIKKALSYANKYKESEEIDFESARSIAKKILIQKEKEFNEMVN